MADSQEGGNAPGFEPAVHADVQVAAGSSSATADENGAASGDPATTVTPGEGESQTPNPETKPEGEGVTPEAPVEFQEIIEGWKEDRMALSTAESQNRQLRDELDQLKTRLGRYEGGMEDEADDEDLAGLTREQREARIVEKHNQKEAAKLEQQKTEVAKEISFHERTNPFFRSNKEAILKVADSFNATSLDQAIKIFQAQHSVAERTKKALEAEEARKKAAAGNSNGGNNSGTPVIKGYDPQRDGAKSIRDLYREGGIG